MLSELIPLLHDSLALRLAPWTSLQQESYTGQTQAVCAAQRHIHSFDVGKFALSIKIQAIASTFKHFFPVSG